MKTTDNYNDWTNYETWRVYTQIFKNAEHAHYMNAKWLKEFAEAVMLIGTDENSVAYDFAICFLDGVNWDEIAEAVSNRD